MANYWGQVKTTSNDSDACSFPKTLHEYAMPLFITTDIALASGFVCECEDGSTPFRSSVGSSQGDYETIVFEHCGHKKRRSRLHGIW